MIKMNMDTKRNIVAIVSLVVGAILLLEFGSYADDYDAYRVEGITMVVAMTNLFLGALNLVGAGVLASISLNDNGNIR